MRKFASTFAMLFLFCFLAYGQTQTVTGTVKDDKGEPIPFASILETGTNNGSNADAGGNFIIKIKPGSQLTISATGYDPVTMTPGEGLQNISLKTRAAAMQEVVVTTALGVARQSREIGYSTAKVKGTELTQGRVVNLQNGLTGKVSGLNIQTVNNGVFADTRITLRGIRSLTGNNQPMLVLDGVPIALGYLNSINPNDVLEVNILKSAAATAVYGPDGVNGAIIVNTRRGSKNKPTISFSHTIQMEEVSYMPKFQKRFGSGSSVDINGIGVYDPIENQGYGDEFDGSIRQIGRAYDFNHDGDITDHEDTLFASYEARPDEKKKFWDRGLTNQTDVSYSTGDFYLSAQNVLIKGVMPKDENRRTSIRMAAQKEYNKFKASFNVTYTQTNYEVNAGSQFGNGRDYTPYWNLINTPMQIPISNFKDWRNDFWSNPNHYYNDYYYNPYWFVDNFRDDGRADDLLGNVELNLKANSWLNFTYRFGATISSGSDKSIQYPWTYSPESIASGKATASSGDIAPGVIDRSSFTSRLNSEFFITATKKFNRLKVDGLLGHSYRDNYSKAMNVSSVNLGIPGVYNVSARKGELSGGEGTSRSRLQRFFGKVGFGYNNWAFVEATGSYDYDSRLSNPYNYDIADVNYFYPGVSASVVLSEAISALKNSKIISYLKVRGSVSKSGNSNVSPYSLENVFLPGNNFPYGNLLGYTASNTLFKDKYSPEFVNTQELGVEVGFLRNRINFEGTIYRQNNTDQLITVAYSSTSGYGNALLNAAEFTNKGIELDLKLTPLVTLGDWRIDFKVNYTLQSNEVTSLIEGVNELGIGNGNYVIVGKPAYTFKLTDYTRDSLGRVVVDKGNGFPTVDPGLRVFGQTLPKHLLGLNLNVNWKNLSFAAVADYRTGNQIYSGIGPDMDFSGISYRTGPKWSPAICLS
jgi:TonB-linked SusC/RagA family outer membrane protein